MYKEREGIKEREKAPVEQSPLLFSPCLLKPLQSETIPIERVVCV
jgi:hypothetical protein